MHSIDWKRKLSSRKLWAAIVGVITGVAMIFGLDEGVITNVSGAVVAIGSIVAYINAEGAVDAAQKVDPDKIEDAVEAAQKALESVQEDMQ